jgi:hypothetical protein
MAKRLGPIKCEEPMSFAILGGPAKAGEIYFLASSSALTLAITEKASAM